MPAEWKKTNLICCSFLHECNFNLLQLLLNIGTLVFIIFILRFCPEFWQTDMDIYILFSVFTSRLTSILEPVKFQCFSVWNLCFCLLRNFKGKLRTETHYTRFHIKHTVLLLTFETDWKVWIRDISNTTAAATLKMEKVSELSVVVSFGSYVSLYIWPPLITFKKLKYFRTTGNYPTLLLF